MLEPKGESSLVGPLNYHERLELALSPEKSQVQNQLNILSEHAKLNKMKINHEKTKIMLFNPGNDFQPNIEMEGRKLDVVEQMKLLGVVITSDLKWDENTDFITSKAFRRLWLLRRLKKLGASRKAMLDIYTKNVRSVLEYASVVWSSSITRKNMAQIERVQKAAFAIILDKQYASYEDACTVLNMDMLSERREKLARQFAIKASQHPIHKDWFVPNDDVSKTWQTKLKFRPPQGRTERFLSSAIPYLTNLLNEQ